MKQKQTIISCLRQALLPLVLVGLMTGCATIGPVDTGAPVSLDGPVFTHDRFDRFLETFVNDQGLVNYRAVAQAPDLLDAFYRLIAHYSPDSNPQLFPDADHRLAYWINAYNTAAIKTVLTYYPIGSVLDVKTPALFFFLSNKAGFFFFQRQTFGGRTTSLYYLENKVIRKRFKDPRIHFALNCAAAGCPRLPRRAFTGASLQMRLDEETRRFLSEARNFNIDHQEKTINLSSIFKWYKNDFTQWLARHYPDRKADLLSYIRLYLPPDREAALAGVADRYRLRFIPYDWGLNDQARESARSVF